ERKLQLVFECLVREPWGSGVLSREQCSFLSALAGRRLGASLAPGRRSSAVNESCQSLLFQSDISYDRTEDDVDVDMTVVRTLKRKAQERQRMSLAPQIGPVVVAKRHRSSVAPHNAVSVPPVPPFPASSLLPAAVVPQRRSRQGHCVSAHAGGPGQKSRTEGSSLGQPAPAPFPSPPRSLPPPQHQFTSKTTGLYRVPGAEQQVREWKRRLLQAGGVLPALGGVDDIHVVCGVLKDFLRGLKEPLVTFNLHPAFLQAADIPDDAACSMALRHVVSKLPPANRDTLAFLMLHLLRVSRSPDCKMDVLNLSRVFGPTLVGHGSANP
ncbi:PREDICTED: rho GTPase-activating protein gacR-like, partial [Mesitornis unicolor]|uniref:rho GTPase-activating protein gacR-like n=1 Tax=Mesitornis unicolor TaxID=54374 RepID=UPI0005292A91